MIIDGTDLLLGRMATQIAKTALLGEAVTVINCEKVAISGTKAHILKKYNWKRSIGEPSHGPHFPRRSDLIVKRTVRGMLPYKTPRGRDALASVKCFLGVPEDIKEKAETIPKANVEKLPNLKYTYLGRISKLMGAKQQ